MGSRYLLICTALIAEKNSDSAITVIWTFGRKSTLRSVRLSGQIWDAKSGRKLWAAYAIGFNNMVPYESPALEEEICLPGPIPFILPALCDNRA